MKKKKFNIAGVCYPHIHYMMDNTYKLKEILALITEGEYFTINRPRQFGKTTSLFHLERLLKRSEEYVCIRLSFETRSGHESSEAFAQMFWEHLMSYIEYEVSDLYAFTEQLQPSVTNMRGLSKAITKLVHKTQRKLVLLIDEVDASSNYMPFLEFLAMLRDKFLDRYSRQHATFQSVILAGVHDIKSLKYKLRDSKDAKYNSPWNIAIDFKVDMRFNPQEIAPMLEEYCAAENVTMDIPAIAERLHYYTSGYPFLVSKLCKNIAEDILPQKPQSEQMQWTLEDVEQSVQFLLKEENPNFESLIKNLENNDDLYNLAHAVIINGADIPFNPDEPIMKLGRMYGVFKENGRLKIHNRVYEQRLYNYMTAKTYQSFITRKESGITDYYISGSNKLDFEHVLTKFQQFMKEQRSTKDLNFLEREWRLIFLSFLKPIINSKGYDFKEVETSEEKRMDIVVTFYNHKYILELKIWRGPKAHAKGMDQLAGYLDIHGVDKGYLLIFDTRQEKSENAMTIQHKGKEVFAVWV